MTQLPDFSTMTKEEIGDWFLSTDTHTLLARAERPSEPMAQADAGGEGRPASEHNDDRSMNTHD